MNKKELNVYLECEMLENLRIMKNFQFDKNIQVVEMYNIHKGKFEALDDLYYKINKNYYKCNRY